MKKFSRIFGTAAWGLSLFKILGFLKRNRIQVDSWYLLSLGLTNTSVILCLRNIHLVPGTQMLNSDLSDLGT